MPEPKATIIISVYNNLKFLQLVLAGFELQTEQDFEIIVSDDGSSQEFGAGLRQEIAKSAMNIVHNWHADQGFRKNMILNRSIEKARAPYLIFIDGDCIPHPRFVAEHLDNARPGCCLVGRRVDLSGNITRRLNPENVRAGILYSKPMMLAMLADYLLGRLSHLKSGIYVRNPWLRKYFNRKSRGLLGANFSLYRSDMLAINGFDERYNRPTFGEDSDVELRLRLHGIRFQPLVGIAVLYHCHHNLLPRPEESRLQYEQAIRENRAFTPYGIRRAVPPAAS